ncbi:MAG TPA: Crp/Fnr family transcriptional regulator [Gaiellaceae bacterium]|nr:Crp/Fnr family transcriptional regulator [Gaiellaceae bacterium]
MDAENSGGVRSRLLESVPSPDAELAAHILSACPTVDVVAGEPYFRSSLPAGSLLIVERGFVIFRLAPPRTNRSIITCDAGPGRVVLPPASEEVLFALVDSKLTVISPEALDALLALPRVAKTLLEQLALTLGQKQETIANFGSTRHIERVRRKLLQLGRNYGRVARDGVRIDFPLSHTLLADMVGSSRETVTRSLDELQREGFVARRGHNYRLLVSPDTVAAETRP